MLLMGRRLAHDMKRYFLLPALSLLPSAVTTANASTFHSLSFAHHPTSAARARRSSRIIHNMSTDSPIDNTTQLLPLQDASHNSVKVVITPDFSRANFRERLSRTLDSCRSQSKTSLWIEVDMSCASLIEEMQEFGFIYHHAQGTTASLNVWLDASTTNKIPEFATHHVGVGALVVNSNNAILLVRELRNNLRPWKLPGGLSDLEEDLPVAACREVLEETGIECTFKSIVSFRHSHGLSHGRSDLYFVCRLEPVEEVDDGGNVVIPEPIPCQEEIEAAAWVPMEEYRAMIHGKDGHPMMQHVMKLYDQDHDIQQTVIQSIVPGRKPSPIYHPPIQNE